MVNGGCSLVQVHGCGNVVVGERHNNGTDEHRTNMALFQTNITERSENMEYRTNMRNRRTDKTENRSRHNVLPNKHIMYFPTNPTDHRTNMTKSWKQADGRPRRPTKNTAEDHQERRSRNGAATERDKHATMIASTSHTQDMY